MTDWLPTDDTPLTEAAIAYAEHGFRVLPVWSVTFSDGQPKCACGKPHEDRKSIGKHPIGLAWQRNATSDAKLVADARRKRPQANIGLAMGGEGRLVAVDIDGEPGRASWAAIEATHGPTPATLTSRSGRVDGGEHRIFRVPIELDIKRLGNRTGMRHAGVDTRTDNGQIVAAPSMHASGARYTWINRVDVANLPAWLFDELAAPLELVKPRREVAPPPAPSSSSNASYLETVTNNACARIAGANEGGRNSLLWTKACTVFEYYVGERADPAVAWQSLERAGVACGLPASEVSATLTKAWTKAQTSPRYIKPAEHQSLAPSAPASTPAVVDDTAWTAQLSYTSKGDLKNTFANVCKILRLDSAFKGRFTFNEMRLSPCVDGKPMLAHHFARIREVVENRWQIAPSRDAIVDAVNLVAKEHSSHPVREYLGALAWDGTQRIDRVAPEILGLTTTAPITIRMLRCFFISAVARALDAGCKVDTSLVIVGDQGLKKSTFFEVLAGEWFSRSYADVRSKDGVLAVHAAWIYEWGEIERITTKLDAGDVKAFLVIAKDFVRPPYGMGIVELARSGIIAGTTNRSFLDDDTGSRRFHPIHIFQDIDRVKLAEWRDQLWAEAVHAYRAGETWWLDKADELAREASAEEHEVENPWLEPIAKYVKTSAQRMVGITTADILEGAMNIERGRMQRADEMRASKAMRSLGWRQERTTRYGVRLRTWVPRSGSSSQSSSVVTQPAQPNAFRSGTELGSHPLPLPNCPTLNTTPVYEELKHTQLDHGGLTEPPIGLGRSGSDSDDRDVVQQSGAQREETEVGPGRAVGHEDDFASYLEGQGIGTKRGES